MNFFRTASASAYAARPALVLAVAGLDLTKLHVMYTCHSMQTYRRNRQSFL